MRRLGTKRDSLFTTQAQLCGFVGRNPSRKRSFHASKEKDSIGEASGLGENQSSGKDRAYKSSK